MPSSAPSFHLRFLRVEKARPDTSPLPAVITFLDMVLQRLALGLLFFPYAAAPQLDYGFFKERVQPIFLKKRAGHARCITCHSHGVPPLEPLAGGATTWTEEQSRKNF